MLDAFESPQRGMQDAGDARMWDAKEGEGDAAASPTGSEDPEDEILEEDLEDDDDDLSSRSFAKIGARIARTSPTTTKMIWTMMRTISTMRTMTTWTTIS